MKLYCTTYSSRLYVTEQKFNFAKYAQEAEQFMLTIKTNKMKRSTFLIIAAIIAAVFGGMMFFFPDKVTEGFGAASTPFSKFLMREMGLIILCSSVLNFLVRNEADSLALKAIFVFNMAYHLTMIPIVLFGVSQGVFTIDKSIGGLVAHLFIGIGSLYYLLKIKISAR